MKYFEITATGVDTSDLRYDGFAARREGFAGLGWHFISFIQANTEAEAIEKFRKSPRFRRTARISATDWQTCDIYVTPTTKSRRIDPIATEAQLDQGLAFHLGQEENI